MRTAGGSRVSFRWFRPGSIRPPWLAVAAFLTAGGAHAEESAKEPVRFEYHAPAECPAENEFSARVLERSARGRTALPGELARSFRVTLSLDGNGSVGRVDFVDVDAAPVTRSVRGASCDEVTSGIALVTALAIDARTQAGVTEVEPAAVPAAQPAPLTPPLSPARSEPRPTTSDSRSRAQLTAGVGGGYVGWLGPGGGVSVDVFVAGSLSRRGPALRLSGIHVLASGSAGPREARFRAWGGRADVCPLTAVTGVFFFQPCGGVDFGSLQASGVKSAALPEPKEGSAAFLDALLIGRLGAVLERRLVLELRGELSRPLLTHEFGFERPFEVVFRPPFLALGASAGVGVRFP